MRRIAFLFFILVSFSHLYSQSNSFIRGVDISFTPQIEDLGGKYKINGVVKDVLDIFKESGVNYVRLRIWHTPNDPNDPKHVYCGLQKTLAYAKRIKAKGLKFLLDIHYSDWWADPGKQTKPAAWANLSFDVLKDSVYSYTKNIITALKNQNTLPDMVQVGNEITGGMLWPDGKLYGVGNESDQWIKFSTFLKQGIKGVKDVAGTAAVKIMIHIDRGGDYNSSIYFYDHIIAQGVEFDIIGLSYYPWWHGTLTDFNNNINNLATRYNKDIVIAETAYPMSNKWVDATNNVAYEGQKYPLIAGYPATVKGQKDFITALSKLVKDAKNKKGIGFFYWEPAYISVPPIGSSWDYYTTFDPLTGEALNSIAAFQNLDSLKSVNIKIKVNTSTLGDTLKSSGFVQVRGEVSGIASSNLPSGDAVKWDATSQLVCKNMDGDNWEYSFKMYPADQLQFNFWTGYSKNIPTYRNLGWESAVTPYDGSAINARLFTAGLKDSTMEIQYINSTNNKVSQYWSPIPNKKDSIAIFFRVNISELSKKGQFDPAANYVTVRGDQTTSSGRLSWDSNKLILKREEISIADGSFWSGVAYFPQNKIKAGTEIKYKFFVENSKFGGWESGISDRTFKFPTKDSTLMWKFFNDKNILTRIESNGSEFPYEFSLAQNYPNPFNPETTISYSVKETSFVTLKVCDVLGREVVTLVDELKQPGFYHTQFPSNGVGSILNSQLSAGVYFYTLRAGDFVSTKKMILMK